MRKARFTQALLYALSFAACSSQQIAARPTNYAGGFAASAQNQPKLSDFSLIYSFRYDLALAVRAMQSELMQGESEGYFGQINLLAKRWNKSDFQANLYFSAGQGIHRLNKQNHFAWLMSAEADAENRQYLISTKAETIYTGIATSPSGNHQAKRWLPRYELRMGAAPYLAEFNELATWLLVQAQYYPAYRDQIILTPLLRFFYKTVLWEAGVSTQRDWLFNFVVQL